MKKNTSLIFSPVYYSQLPIIPKKYNKEMLINNISLIKIRVKKTSHLPPSLAHYSQFLVIPKKK